MTGSDPGAVIAVDRRAFSRVVGSDTQVLRLAGGFEFIEGPTWTENDGGYLLFSDIPRDRIHRWSGIGSEASVYRESTGHTNGNTRDANGHLLSCEHTGRRVAIEDERGVRSTLIDRYNGKRLNSPNDVVVKSDGTIWFTDPPYGLPADESGRELDQNHVFRFDPHDGTLTSVADDFDRPNGLCFSPDETTLHVADSSHRAHTREFQVDKQGRLHGGRVFCEIKAGVSDGIRCDVDGRLWSSAGDGVHVFTSRGELVGRIVTPLAPLRRDRAVIAPEAVANLCFVGGGQTAARLYLTACTSLYAIDVLVRGATQGRTG
jgi:gluconolactonase